jgi:hypothetical protein
MATRGGRRRAAKVTMTNNSTMMQGQQGLKSLTDQHICRTAAM